MPDITGLASLHEDHWRAFGLRLREIGLTSECVDPIAAVGEGLPPLHRAPLRRWHLARLSGPAALAMRLLVFDDSVSPQEAAEALGLDLRDCLLDAGLLARRAEKIVSLCPLGIAGGFHLLSDDLASGGDAVMGASDATANLCRAVWPSSHVNRVLDVGCGAGTVGLVLSLCAGSVVATDINPRALTVARVNAAINGIRNVEFRLGDCFAPVCGETFDLIVSQPPFVPRPPEARPAVYLHGGVHGDELPMRILAGMADHLGPRGRAVVMVQWPETGDLPIEQRVASAVGASDARCLHIRFPSSDPDLHCGMYAASEIPEPGEAFERRVRAWRDHFEAQGIRSLRTVCTVIQRNPDLPAWSAVVDVPDDSAEFTGATIDRWIANRDLAHSGRPALLEASLRLPNDAVIAKESNPGCGKPKYFVRREDSAFGSVELGEDSLLLISLVHEEATVSRAIEKFAAQRGLDARIAADQLLPVVEQALSADIIESSRPQQKSYRPSI